MRGTPSLLFHIHAQIPTYLAREELMMLRMYEFGLLVMLGMLAGHAGDVENIADDVGRLVTNTYIS